MKTLDEIKCLQKLTLQLSIQILYPLTMWRRILDEKTLSNSEASKDTVQVGY